MNEHHPSTRPLPHHRLQAYRVALELLALVRDARIRDPELRDQAMRAAKSICLNTAEAVGRVSPADKARVFGIARGEVVEVAAALEVAAITSEIDPTIASRSAPILDRLYALLTGLAR